MWNTTFEEFRSIILPARSDAALSSGSDGEVEHEEKATSKAAAAAAHPDGRANETDKRRRHIRREFSEIYGKFSVFFIFFKNLPLDSAKRDPSCSEFP